MATKKKTNTISALYKTIDQKQLSDQAKETLKKLRLATGNFRSKDERANEAFSTFYNKLLEKKPTAVKTTKEYKDMVRQRQVEHMKKIREARKEKEESKKGQGNDRDAGRPAKPYGWRLRGKHNYRKPTLKQISNGEAYYEGRVNRADVKRKKFPMLEKGGYMEHGGAIKNQYEGRTPEDIWDSYTKEQKLHFLYDHHEEINEYKGISSEEGNPWFNVSYKSNWANLDEDVKNRFANHVRGGQYAKGGMTDHNLMIGDTIKQSFGNILVVENDGKTYLVNINTGQRWTDSEWWSLSKGEITKYTKMAKGGNVYSSDDAYEAIILKDGVEVDRVVLRAKNKGEARMMYEDYHEGKMMKTHGEDITYEIIVAPSKMAKGGYVDVKENLIKELGRLQRQLNSDRLRVFKEDGSTEEMERQRERASKKARFDDILKTLNEIESNEKMAMGGEVFYKESHKMGH
jgi:hypothetical protein